MRSIAVQDPPTQRPIEITGTKVEFWDGKASSSVRSTALKTTKSTKTNSNGHKMWLINVYDTFAQCFPFKNCSETIRAEVHLLLCIRCRCCCPTFIWTETYPQTPITLSVGHFMKHRPEVPELLCTERRAGASQCLSLRRRIVKTIWITSLDLIRLNQATATVSRLYGISTAILTGKMTGLDTNNMLSYLSHMYESINHRIPLQTVRELKRSEP
jgi:hypothetical protein